MPKPSKAFLALCHELTAKAFENKAATPITNADRLAIHQDRIYKWGVEHGHYPDLKGVQFRTPEYDCVWTVLHYHRNNDWVCQESTNKTTCNFQSIIIEHYKIKNK